MWPKNLLEVLSPPFHVEDHEISIGASIGISLFPENAVAATDLLVQERLSLENQLRAALARSEIAQQLAHHSGPTRAGRRSFIRSRAASAWRTKTGVRCVFQ